MAYSADEIATLKTRLAAYVAAEQAVLRNQSYQMPDGRQLVRANLAEIRKGISDLSGEVASATGARRGRARRAVCL